MEASGRARGRGEGRKNKEGGSGRSKGRGGRRSEEGSMWEEEAEDLPGLDVLGSATSRVVASSSFLTLEVEVSSSLEKFSS